MTNKKINTLGEFITFRGVTFISHILDLSIEAKFSFFHEFLSKQKHIQKYYTLVPLKGYHVTFIDLFSEKIDASYLLDQILNNFDTILDLNKEVDIFDEPYIEITNMFISTSLGLNCKIDYLTNLNINMLRTKYNLNKATHGYHITLAYKYKDGIEQDTRAQQELKNIKSLIICLFYDQFVKLYKPKIVTFNDMTSF